VLAELIRIGQRVADGRGRPAQRRATFGAALMPQPRLESLPFETPLFPSAPALIFLQTLGMKLAMPAVGKGAATGSAEIAASSRRFVSVHHFPLWRTAARLENL
jgi:hypothetical protein